MSKYLEAAAALVKKVVDENEKDQRSAYLERDRIKAAKLCALLAAIDKGLMPEAVAEEIYGQLRSTQ